jgi:hypothetical protein
MIHTAFKERYRVDTLVNVTIKGTDCIVLSGDTVSFTYDKVKRMPFIDYNPFDKRMPTMESVITMYFACMERKYALRWDEKSACQMNKAVEHVSGRLHGVVTAGRPCSIHTTFAYQKHTEWNYDYESKVTVSRDAGGSGDVRLEIVHTTLTDIAGDPRTTTCIVIPSGSVSKLQDVLARHCMIENLPNMRMR